MYLTNCLSVLLLASFANAAIDPSRYTVAFHFEGTGYRCLGGLISDQFVVSVGECFADKMGNVYDVKVTAVVGVKDLSNVDGAIKTEVAAVFLPKTFVTRRHQLRRIHDFAVVKLKDKLNLEANNLVALKSPPVRRDVYTGITNTSSIAGYGLNSAKLGELKYEDVDVVKFMKCSNPKSEDDYASILDFCVKRREGKCLSDRGSPYVEGDVLVGVQMKCVDDSPYELYKMVSGFSFVIGTAFKDGEFMSIRYYYS